MVVNAARAFVQLLRGFQTRMYRVRMNTQPRFMLVRIRVPLPLFIDGGLTRWKLYTSSCGKNGSRLELLAKCVSDPERAMITIYAGRERDVMHSIMSGGILVKRGTLEAKLMSRLVREGCAEIVR